MGVRVRLHRSELDQLLRSPSGAVHKEVSKYTRRTTNAAKGKAPVDTGKGRASINGQVEVRGNVVIGRVGTGLDYMLWQHEGTGVYVGNGPITPKQSSVLVFRPKNPRPAKQGSRGGKGPLVFAKSVKGVPPQPYLVEALEESCPWPVTVHD